MKKKERTTKRSRRGVSLIEVMVAVVLLGMMATVHTIVTLRYAVRNRAAAIGVNRAAAISNAVDLFTTMPFASVATNTGCATITEPTAYPHQRCVTTSAVSSTITRVEIIIVPTNTAFRPDTVRVDRAQPPAGSLFS
jgi:prepilin-type N-terminal cleavage/methylation domain-containing protein